MITSDWQDVSYKYKSGVWERNLRTGEEREVKPPVILPKEAVVPLADHVVIKRSLPIPDFTGTVSDSVVEHARKPKTKGWKNSGA